MRGKTLWDALELLVVPLVLVLVGLSLTSAQQSAREIRAANEQRTLEEQKAQDAALLSYMDVMKELLLDEKLRDSGSDSSEVAVATAQTLLVLERMDARHKTLVLHLLRDSRLIGAEGPLYDFEGADLHKVNAEGMDLSYTFLSSADLGGANLNGATLTAADLSGADLTNAELVCFVEATPTADIQRCANLNDATLQGANLSGADLSGADLNNTLLINANLSGTDLSSADLSDANLSDAYEVNDEGDKRLISGEALEKQVQTLDGATMPNGRTYEDWAQE